MNDSGKRQAQFICRMDEWADKREHFEKEL